IGRHAFDVSFVVHTDPSVCRLRAAAEYVPAVQRTQLTLSANSRARATVWIAQAAKLCRSGKRGRPYTATHSTAVFPQMNEAAEAAKKSTLLMIPYGLYVLTSKHGDQVGAGTVNWVTQTSFKPPLVAMGVKTDSGIYAALKGSGTFALSFLASGQKAEAFAFFKPTNVDGNTINGQAFETHETGNPVISSAAAWVEGRVVGEVAVGDHSCIVGEVTN